MTRDEEYKNALNAYMNIDARITKTLRLIAIGAIKKQIPKKPIGVITEDNEFICMICPSCQQVAVEFNDTYCSVCGQKIDWSE